MQIGPSGFARAGPGGVHRSTLGYRRAIAEGPAEGAIGGRPVEALLGAGRFRGRRLGRLVTGKRAERTTSGRDRRCRVECSASGEKKGMTIAVTGATGLIGSRLVARLAALGHVVRVLTRNERKARAKLPYRGLSFFQPTQWDTAICGCDGVVNLAGKQIATRWTPALKEEIRSSRVGTTKRVVAAINRCPQDAQPGVLVNISAVGFYGTSNDSLNESSPSGNDYLAKICREWEAAAKEAKDSRVVILRTGIVLAKEGGALERMIPIFNIFAGGPLGSGQQWVSWIHRDDVVLLIIEALQNGNYRGTYNATSPNPVRMGEFCRALGAILGRPSWLPVPEFALQTLLGEGAMLVVDGQRVLPSRTQLEGFKFKYDDVGAALRNVLSS